MATNHQPSALPTSSWDLTSTKDEVLDELYTFREQYAARFEYDLERIYADLKEKEAQNPARRSDLQPLEPKS